MSLLKFGEYFGEIPDLRVGAHLWLDGNDGFEDQTLWYYKKGDRLTFIIDPNEEEPILQHKMVQVEILKDTGTNDFADTIILRIDNVTDFFLHKPITFDNDFLELTAHYSFLWAKTLESKERYPHSGYKMFEMIFLGHSELNEVIVKGNYTTVRNINDNTRIYAELLFDKRTVRVITVGGGGPENCFLYDINDINKYRKVISEKISNAVWEDEKKWWTLLLK